MRTVDGGKLHASGLADDGMHFLIGDGLIEQLAAATLGNQAGGNVKLEEVLKFNIAGAVE